MKTEVLLAAYNGEAYIGQQLDSILNQTVPDVRILASDDGSADGTPEILREYQRKYPQRVRVRNRDKRGRFRDRPGRVPAAAMNFFWLLSQADADYVMLSDQDDVWRPDKTEKLLGKMKEIELEEIPALTFSDMEVTDRNLRPISPSFVKYSHSDPGRVGLSQILVENPVTGGSLMMNRALLRQVQTVPADCYMHDWWIALCASCFGTIGWVAEPLYSYRQHGSNQLGARKTGGWEDLRDRMKQGAVVRENYRRMFAQARAFARTYRDRLSDGQKMVLSAYLALPLQSPAGRARNIARNHFYKSSPIQTWAQCLTIPSFRR